jgi:hypothetical protein
LVCNTYYRFTTREVKEITKEIQNDTAAIKQNTTRIFEQIELLRALLPAGEPRNEGSNFILDRYLDKLTDYAETIRDGWDESDIENDLTPERYSILVIYSMMVLI